MKKILTTAAALVVSGFAFAYDVPQLQDAFDALDVGDDGYITWVEAEAKPELFAQFAELDINGDDVLTIEEFEVFYREHLAPAAEDTFGD